MVDERDRTVGTLGVDDIMHRKNLLPAASAKPTNSSANQPASKASQRRVPHGGVRPARTQLG